ncbi:MAG: chemotaxis protein CheW [Nitrospinota bacterium]
MNEETEAEFYSDSQSHIDLIEDAMLRLESNLENQSLIDDIFRRVHSIKGNAGILGLTEIHDHGQIFETFLSKVRKRRRATSGEVDIMLHKLDTLKSLMFGNSSKKSNHKLSADRVSRAKIGEVDLVESSKMRSNGAIKSSQIDEPSIRSQGSKEPLDVMTFLVFMLDNERYGMNISLVKEIILKEPVTPVPNSLTFVDGVMNLRDQVIAVFDLKRKLSIPASNDNGASKNVIIVDIGKSVTGLYVDKVLGIEEIGQADITPIERFHDRLNTDYLSGVAKSSEGPIILINILELCPPNERLY